MIEEKPDKLIEGSYTISLDIAGRRVQIGGYIQQGDDKEAIIKKMNVAQDCIDHQLVRADLKSNEGKLKGALAGMENLIQDHEQVLARVKALKPGKSPHQQDAVKLKNFEPTLDQMKFNIQMYKDIIRENRKTLGLDAEGPSIQ